MNTSFDSLRILNTYGAFGRYKTCNYYYELHHLKITIFSMLKVVGGMPKLLIYNMLVPSSNDIGISAL